MNIIMFGSWLPTNILSQEGSLRFETISEQGFVDKFKGSSITLSLTFVPERFDIKRRFSKHFLFGKNIFEPSDINLADEDIVAVAEWEGSGVRFRYEMMELKMKIFFRT